MINAAEQIGERVEEAKRRQAVRKKEVDGRSYAGGATASIHSRSNRGTAKAKRMVDVSQTVEFVETRSAKVTGQRAAFEGRVLSDYQQEMYQLNAQQDQVDQGEKKDREEQAKRLKQLQALNKMIESYSVDTFRNALMTDVEETKEETVYMGQANYRQLEEVLDLVRQMTNQHSDSLEQPVAEIIEGCFKEYAKHLDDLERTDMQSLKKRLGEMKGMLRNLAKDLEGAD